MKVAVVVIAWAICDVVAYGLVYHYYAERFKCFGWPNRWWHRTAAMIAAVCGPVGIIHRLVLAHDDTDKTPWRLRYRTVTSEESWNDYHRRWPSVPKERWNSSSLWN